MKYNWYYNLTHNQHSWHKMLCSPFTDLDARCKDALEIENENTQVIKDSHKKVIFKCKAGKILVDRRKTPPEAKPEPKKEVSPVIKPGQTLRLCQNSNWEWTYKVIGPCNHNDLNNYSGKKWCLQKVGAETEHHWDKESVILLGLTTGRWKIMKEPEPKKLEVKPGQIWVLDANNNPWNFKVKGICKCDGNIDPRKKWCLERIDPNSNWHDFDFDHVMLDPKGSYKLIKDVEDSVEAVPAKIEYKLEAFVPSINLPGFKTALAKATLIRRGRDLNAFVICKDGNNALLYVEPEDKNILQDGRPTYHHTFAFGKLIELNPHDDHSYTEEDTYEETYNYFINVKGAYANKGEIEI